MSKLLDGYKFYKSIQGTKYSKGMDNIKNSLSEFHSNLAEFSDKIFIENNALIAVRNGKGHWLKGNGTTISEYILNRYKPQEDDSTLVIYFNASAKKDEGLFVSIGLNDDKMSNFEKEHHQEIYSFLEQECKKITIEGFERKDFGRGERVFSVIDETKFETLNYNNLIQELKNVYENTYKRFYEYLTQLDFKTLQNLNHKLKSLEEKLLKEAIALDEVLIKRVEDKEDLLHDYEINLIISFYLKEDDVHYDESEDNILVTLREYLKNISIDEKKNPWRWSANHNEFRGQTNHLMKDENHCWLYHSLYDHTHLRLEDLLRIGTIWSDLKVCYQYKDAVDGN